MPSPPSLHALDALSDDERAALLATASLLSLADVLASIPDPRSRHGKRYDLPFLLTCLAAALLCGYDSTDAARQWCREHHTLLRQVFGRRQHLPPSGSLYRRLLPRLSVSPVEWAVASWVLHPRPHPDTEALALDGKTLCGARQGEERAPHLLRVSTHTSEETLLQVRGDGKTNQQPIARDLLGWLLLQDRVITADALHTTTDFAPTVLHHGGHYVLPVKDNQPLLHADLVEYFAAPAGTWIEEDGGSTAGALGGAAPASDHRARPPPHLPWRPAGQGDPPTGSRGSGGAGGDGVLHHPHAGRARCPPGGDSRPLVD